MAGSPLQNQQTGGRGNNRVWSAQLQTMLASSPAGAGEEARLPLQSTVGGVQVDPATPLDLHPPPGSFPEAVAATAMAVAVAAAPHLGGRWVAHPSEEPVSLTSWAPDNMPASIRVQTLLVSSIRHVMQKRHQSATELSNLTLNVDMTWTGLARCIWHNSRVHKQRMTTHARAFDYAAPC